MPTRPGYPRHWEADIVARDGATMHIRPIVPADAPALQALHLAQSERSRFFRFFGHRGELTERELARFTQVDHRERVALVVTDQEGGPLLAFGCYDAVDPRTAEVAFYVADSQQGRGLGSVLLDHLAAAGRERGFTRFVADVLPTNAKMLAVFREAGYSVASGLEDGVVEVSIDISTTDKSWRVMTAREQHSESRSMGILMDPGRIVHVGSGRAARLLDLLPPAEAVDLPGEGTLAVVAVDDPVLARTLLRLGAEGIRAAVVLSGRGARDPQWHAAVLEAARGTGMRLLGPGSYGLVTAAGTNLSLSPGLSSGGCVGVFAQSARSSAELADRLAARSVPVSGFVSAGHRTDVSGNDAMQWWFTDDRTRVVALSLDSIGNPRKFARIAGHLASTRTVVCHIHSATGQAAPPGHLVRTSPLPRAVLSDMLRQAGVIEAADHAELIDLVHVASRRPVAGGRVHVAATTPPARELVVRAVRAHGLTPTDTAGDARIVVDLPLAGDPEEWRVEVEDEGASLAIATVPRDGIPVVDDVERGVRLIATLAGARARDDSPLVTVDDVSPAAAASVLSGHGEGVLAPAATDRLLAAYGIVVVPTLAATGEEAALAVATHLGFPLAVKAEDPGLRHRVDLGGVRLDVHDTAGLAHAVREFRARGVLTVCLQRMVPPGPACVLEAVEDPLYGPVVSFGLAGDAVEILGDVAYRITPLSQRDVAELVAEPRAAVRLQGYRGRPSYDLGPLRDLVGRVALLKDDFPVVRRIQLNPVVVSDSGTFALAAVVEVGPGRRTDGSRRTLPTLGLE